MGKEPKRREGGEGGYSPDRNWKYLGIGIQFASSVCLLAASGYGLDLWFPEISPWGTVAGSMCGVALATYYLLKETSR